MIARALGDRRAAPGKTGGTLSPESLGVWETKLGHVARILGIETPLAEVDYEAVGRFLEQRHAERASQHTRSKELACLRFGLRLEKANGNYPHDVDHVTRTRRFAVGYKPRKRHLTWEEIPKLLGGLLVELSNRVKPEKLAEARELHRELTIEQTAAKMGCSVSTVKRYLTLPDPEPTRGGLDRAQHAAWIVSTGARRKESYRAELADHDLDGWTVRLRGTKTAGAERRIPVAPPFRSLLVFALRGRPPQGPMFERWANVHRSLKLACKRAGIEPVSPNDLRRTHFSLLKQEGASLDDLARVAGHTTIRMMELVYGHTNLEALTRALEKVPARGSLVPGKEPS